MEKTRKIAAILAVMFVLTASFCLYSCKDKDETSDTTADTTVSDETTDTADDTQANTTTDGAYDNEEGWIPGWY